MSKDMSADEFVDKLTKIGRELSFLRITEPMSRNAVSFFVNQINADRNTNIVTLKKVAGETVDDFVKWIDELDDKMAVDGTKVVRNNQKILTHCHSSSAEKILIEAHKQGRQFTVFNTETRPLFQGRTTAKHLLAAGVQTTLVVDDSAPFLISEYSGRGLMMDLVIIGCDAISLDGGCVNKVGSFGIAEAAYYEGIDVYIAGSLLKVDANDDSVKEIKIEQRDSKEIWPEAPKGLKMINFAFDRVPARFIRGYITEFGIIKPKNIKKMAKKNYRWMFK
jgi:ribose 1,5-bisphosphate isomerase